MLNYFYTCLLKQHKQGSWVTGHHRSDSHLHVRPHFVSDAGGSGTVCSVLSNSNSDLSRTSDAARPAERPERHLMAARHSVAKPPLGKRGKRATASTSPGAKTESAAPSDASIGLAPTAGAADSTGDVSSASSDSQNVVVCVRVRPGSDSASPCWKLEEESGLIRATENHPAITRRGASSTAHGDTGDEVNALQANPELYTFRFDSLCTPSQSSEDLYKSKIAPVVRAAVEGYNATVFAYGQTGSGKTHTMSGSQEELGVIPRAVEEIFNQIERDQEREYLLRVSYLEIYNESLKDLLAALPSKHASASPASSRKSTAPRPSSPTKGGFTPSAPSNVSNGIRIVEDHAKGRIVLTGIREEIVTSPADVLRLLEDGQRMRHITVESRGRAFVPTKPESGKDAEDGSDLASRAAAAEIRISQLNLIDLAGSERAATEKARRKEGAFINKSLLTLGTVISKLGESNGEGAGAGAGSGSGSDIHVPYRDSKLTRLLQTSLSGNARVAVICTVSPDERHATESLSTLKFGRRCSLVRTSAERGVVMDDRALLLKYRLELEALRAQLSAQPNSSLSLDEASMERKRAHSVQAEHQPELDSLHDKRNQLLAQITHLTNLILTSQSVAAARDAAPGPQTPAQPRTQIRRGRLTDFPVPSLKHFVHDPPASPLPKQHFSDEECSFPPGADLFVSEKEMARLRRAIGAAEAKAAQAEVDANQARQAEAQALTQLADAEKENTTVRSELAMALEKAKKAESDAEFALEAAKDDMRISIEGSKQAQEIAMSGAQAAAEKRVLEAERKASERVAASEAEFDKRIQDTIKESSSDSDALRQEAEKALKAAKDDAVEAVAAAQKEAGEALAAVQQEAEKERSLAKEQSDHSLAQIQAEASAAVSDIKKELGAVQNKLQEAQSNAEHALALEKQAREKSASLSRKSDLLTTEAEALRSQLSQLQSGLEAAKTEAVQAKAEAENLRRLQETSGSEREQAFASQEKMFQTELSDLREAIATAQEELQDARNDAARLTELAMNAHEALESERKRNEEANDFAAKEQERILTLALQSKEESEKERDEAQHILKRITQEKEATALAAVQAETKVRETSLNQDQMKQDLAKSQEALREAENSLVDSKKMQAEMQNLLSTVMSELNQLRPQLPTPEQKLDMANQSRRLEEALNTLEEQRAECQQLQKGLSKSQQDQIDSASMVDTAHEEVDTLRAQVVSLQEDLAQERAQRSSPRAEHEHEVKRLTDELQESESGRTKLAARVKELEYLLATSSQPLQQDAGMATALSDATIRVDSLTCTVSEQQVLITDLEVAVDKWKSKLKTQHSLISRLISASPDGHPKTLDEIRKVLGPSSPQLNGEGGASLSPAPMTPRRDSTLSFSNSTAATTTTTTPTRGSTATHSASSTPNTTAPSRVRPQATGAHSWIYTQPEPLPLHPNSEAGKKIRPRKTIEKDLALLRSSPHVGGKREVFVRGSTPQKRSVSPAPPPQPQPPLPLPSSSQRANTSFNTSFHTSRRNSSSSPSASPTQPTKSPSKLPGFPATTTENSPSSSPAGSKRTGLRLF